MRSVLCRRLLAGLLLGAAAWAAPAMAQSALLAGHPAGTPAPDARTSATRFVALCEKQLQLAPEQAASLHTYLDQEVTYLGTLAANGLDPEPPTLVPTEAEQLNQVMVRLLSPGQLRQFRQLAQTPQAQAYLHSMALLPESATSIAKSKQNKRRTSQMLAQRLDGEE